MRMNTRLAESLEQKYTLQLNMFKGGSDSAQKMADIISNCVKDYTAQAKGNESLPVLFALLKRLNTHAFSKIREQEQYCYQTINARRPCNGSASKRT